MTKKNAFTNSTAIRILTSICRRLAVLVKSACLTRRFLTPVRNDIPVFQIFAELERRLLTLISKSQDIHLYSEPKLPVGAGNPFRGR